MDIRYMMYALTNGKYYVPNRKGKRKTMLKVPVLPKDWNESLDEEKHWRYCFQKNAKLPVQGWKIHLSCNAPEAQKMLDIVAPILFDNKVDFKFVCSRLEINLKNSKYGNRGASGKFITVYPPTESEFIRLLDLLDEATKDIKKGPYILSDKRWKDNNVYFRYGGFAQMFVTIDGEKQLAIINDKGEYIPDKREPSYVIPNFIEEPEIVKKMDLERDAKENQPSKLDEYRIQEALHFSNGGGVYLAINKEGQEVVIKEGRPGAAVDSRMEYAYDRIQREIKALKKLVGIDAVVQYIEDFVVWEHNFLVEEKIKGSTVNTWLALNYPFVDGIKNANDYKINIMQIIRNIINGVESIHCAGVAMGDISLTNIMVNPEDMSVKFIDFESAGDVNSGGMSGLGTMGFMTTLAKNRAQNDWFGILRIARQLFLPICSINDYDPAVDFKLDNWIKDTFGSDALDIIREIEAVCIHEIKGFREKYKPSNSFYEKNYSSSLPDYISKLRKTMLNELKLSPILLHGDIRQYEMKGGKYNILTGGFGVALALFRTGELPDIVKKWVEKYSGRNYTKNLDEGLFSGKAGIASVLYELGYIDKSRKLIDSIDIDKVELGDISILSGLAGIGLAYVTLSSNPQFSDLLSHAILVAKKLIKAYEKDVKIIRRDYDFISMGLIDGWAGVSLFYSSLYRATRDQVWLDAAIATLQKDIDNCISDENGLLQTDDNTRVLPYLAGGSIGIALAIHQIQDLIEPHTYDAEIEGIMKLRNTQVCFNGGLFRGFGSFIVLNNLFSCYKKDEIDIKKLLKCLNNYTVEDENNLYLVGDYGRKLSFDLFSGSAGILLALSDIGKQKYLSWLPVPPSPYLRT